MAAPESYTPSSAVAARMAAVKEAESAAVARGKIEWEVEILLGLEAGRLPPRNILELPIETWPEHNIQENIKRCSPMNYDWVRVAFKTQYIPPGLPGHKRYMNFLQQYAALPASILPEFYSKMVSESTVMQEKLDLAKAIDYVQMGLVTEVVDAYPWKITAITPLIKERAKFRIDFLRHLYPTLLTYC